MEKTQKMDISELWEKYLPGMFNKKKALQAFALHLEITPRRAFDKIRANKILAQEIDFLYLNMGIDHNRDSGFFFNENKYLQILENEKLVAANKYGMGKYSRATKAAQAASTRKEKIKNRNIKPQ